MFGEGMVIVCGGGLLSCVIEGVGAPYWYVVRPLLELACWCATGVERCKLGVLWVRGLLVSCPIGVVGKGTTPGLSGHAV